MRAVLFVASGIMLNYFKRNIWNLLNHYNWRLQTPEIISLSFSWHGMTFNLLSLQTKTFDSWFRCAHRRPLASVKRTPVTRFQHCLHYTTALTTSICLPLLASDSAENVTFTFMFFYAHVYTRTVQTTLLDTSTNSIRGIDLFDNIRTSTHTYTVMYIN